MQTQKYFDSIVVGGCAAKLHEVLYDGLCAPVGIHAGCGALASNAPR
jgi:hypothetical protein